MPKKKPRHQPKQFEVHRTLAHRPAVSDGAASTTFKTSSEIKADKTSRTKRLIVGLLISFLLFFMGILIWDAYNFSNASQSAFGSGNLFDLVSSSNLKGSERGRVNVLIVGYSVDDPNHPAANLTDSIILLSMNTQTHNGYMLSIPRDLYVKIPGNGYGKINEAYRDGGMPLLEQVVSNSFGQPVDYYTLVNYGAVRGIVNAVGGITVNIQSPDPRGLFDPNISTADGGPLKLANGLQKLDGQTALNLTRARGDPCFCGQYAYGFPRSDFDRTQHQRQVFAAIKQKATNWKLVFNPLHNRQLFNAVGQNVETDIQLSELRPLYRLFSSINDSAMQSVSLNDFNGRNLLASTSYQGSTLSPAAGFNDFSQIQAALEQLNQ